MWNALWWGAGHDKQEVKVVGMKRMWSWEMHRQDGQTMLSLWVYLRILPCPEKEEAHRPWPDMHCESFPMKMLSNMMASFPKSSISLCIYVCVCLWVPVHIYACVCWHAEARGGQQMSFSVALLPHFWRHGLLLKKAHLLSFWLDKLGREPEIFLPCSHFHPSLFSQCTWELRVQTLSSCWHVMDWDISPPCLLACFLLMFCLEAGSHILRWVSDFLCSQGWPWTSDPPASIFPGLRFQE